MSKIELTDNFKDIIIKLSDGNPGAVQILVLIMKNVRKVNFDPNLGDIKALLFLDNQEIYGTDIYILYNDKCDRDMKKFISLLVATQLNNFDRLKLKDLSKDQMGRLNVSKEEWDIINSSLNH